MIKPGTNIKFSYLYRDAGNYKVFGSEVFPNINDIELNEIKERIENKLIDREYFEPKKWDIATLELQAFDPELDHAWYELEKVEITDEELIRNVDISLLLNK